MSEGVERLTRLRAEAEAAFERGDRRGAEATILAAAEALADLRRADPERALQQAEQTLALVTGIARRDGPGMLLALVATTEQFARCCQRLDAYPQALAAFQRAVEAASLLALREDADPLALGRLMAAQALCLAQAGRLEDALTVAARWVARARAQARAQRWAGLALAVGGLSLMADVAEALGRELEAQAHLDDARALVEAAASAGQPEVEATAAQLGDALAQRGEPRPQPNDA